jgi:hypothetical protein
LLSEHHLHGFVWQPDQIEQELTNEWNLREIPIFKRWQFPIAMVRQAQLVTVGRTALAGISSHFQKVGKRL